MANSDLHVECFSQALAGRTLDVVVAGSIGAVESVRFIRSLRRLGATVVPWLTRGGAQLVTPTSLAWAAAAPVRDAFSGEASHIACHDALVIAPASADILSQIAAGLMGDPAAALAASYLGQGKPVIAVTNMHASLANSPFYQENYRRLARYLHFLTPRREEGKLKFPEPAVLADEVAHWLNRQAWPQQPGVMLSMGSTRGYIDDVRYISNYSSGRLGSLIGEELHRYGLATHVVAGACEHKPRSYASLTLADTNHSMLAAAQGILADKAEAAILAAAVLDYLPTQRQAGKIKSDAATLSIDMQRADKLIASLNPRKPIKVGFKLEAALTPETAAAIAKNYIARYQLSMIAVNAMTEVSPNSHTATLFSESPTNGIDSPMTLDSKQAIASAIATHVRQRFIELA